MFSLILIAEDQFFRQILAGDHPDVPLIRDSNCSLPFCLQIYTIILEQYDQIDRGRLYEILERHGLREKFNGTEGLVQQQWLEDQIADEPVNVYTQFVDLAPIMLVLGLVGSWREFVSKAVPQYQMEALRRHARRCLKIGSPQIMMRKHPGLIEIPKANCVQGKLAVKVSDYYEGPTPDQARPGQETWCFGSMIQGRVVI